MEDGDIRPVVAVTGAAGDLGFRIVKALTANGASVCALVRRPVRYRGDADQLFDFTAKDDVAAFTADAAMDAGAPGYLRIAGDQISARGLAAPLSAMEGQSWKLHGLDNARYGQTAWTRAANVLALNL